MNEQVKQLGTAGKVTVSPLTGSSTKQHLTQDIKFGEEGRRLEVEQWQEDPYKVEGHCLGLVPPLLKQLHFRVIVVLYSIYLDDFSK